MTVIDQDVQNDQVRRDLELQRMQAWAWAWSERSRHRSTARSRYEARRAAQGRILARSLLGTVAVLAAAVLLHSA